MFMKSMKKLLTILVKRGMYLKPISYLKFRHEKKTPQRFETSAELFIVEVKKSSSFLFEKPFVKISLFSQIYDKSLF